MCPGRQSQQETPLTQPEHQISGEFSPQSHPSLIRQKQLLNLAEKEKLNENLEKARSSTLSPPVRPPDTSLCHWTSSIPCSTPRPGGQNSQKSQKSDAAPGRAGGCEAPSPSKTRTAMPSHLSRVDFPEPAFSSGSQGWTRASPPLAAPRNPAGAWDFSWIRCPSLGELLSARRSIQAESNTNSSWQAPDKPGLTTRAGAGMWLSPA